MTTPGSDATTGQPPPSRTGWYVALVAVAVAVGVTAVLVATMLDEDATGAAGSLELVAEPFDPAASCIVPSADVLALNETAFAGTVSSIEGEQITLTVERWYAGGGADTVAVTAVSGLEALTGSVPWSEGETFLVSATNGVVAYCGLSGPTSPDLLTMYDTAFRD